MAGCVGPNLDGVWTGSHSYKAGSEESEGVAGTLAKVKLTIHGSSYELVEAGLPRAGDIASDGETFTLWASEVAQHKQKAREDGKLRRMDDRTLEYTGPGLDKTPVRLTRSTRGG